MADLFLVISTENPSNYFAAGELPLDIPAGVSNSIPYETNKFYANMFLDDRDDMVFTFPYGVFWDTSTKYGLAVQHTDTSLRAFGTDDSTGAASYYYNPVTLGELVFASSSIDADNNVLNMTDMTEFSAKVTLSDGLSTTDYIEFPLVKGMGLVTAIYHGDLTVRISSIYSILTFAQETYNDEVSTLQKYRVSLNSGNSWLLFVTLPSSDSSFQLSYSDSNIVGEGSSDGVIIQAVVVPESTDLESYYRQAAGQYVTTATLQGSVDCTSASYSFDYTSEGTSVAGSPLIFALPHHLETLDSSILSKYTGITLNSTTKGLMSAFFTDSLSFTETLETDIQFYPWREDFGTTITYSEEQLEKIYNAAVSELDGVDVAATIKSQNSMYYMGKVVDKYAYILLVLNDIVQDEELALSLLSSLKTFFSYVSLNDIYYPLMHDTKFGGVTSTANNDGTTGTDFGAGYYNDHHFHYGYHVHAAAIVGYVDKKNGGTWAEENKGWVNALVRDVANPSTDDPYFPVSRMFDWFHGHSYAKGLFSSGDGKDEESSSEDYNFSYGMKLWGTVIGDKAMEARGDLMLKIQSRSMNLYFLYSDDNTVEPAEYIANKVSGIYFENKIAYTTYFGDNTEYIHGIHMLPITPASSLIRGETFVSQEWDQVLASIIDSVDSGWTGILRLNEALFDASASYDFFSSDSFTDSYLDDGQSLTWSLAYSAAIANGAA